MTKHFSIKGNAYLAVLWPGYSNVLHFVQQNFLVTTMVGAGKIWGNITIFDSSGDNIIKKICFLKIKLALTRDDTDYLL